MTRRDVEDARSGFKILPHGPANGRDGPRPVGGEVATPDPRVRVPPIQPPAGILSTSRQKAGTASHADW